MITPNLEKIQFNSSGTFVLDRPNQIHATRLRSPILDADRMTYWGRRADANFWIENASVAWHEAEAPFHSVARLTLLPKSQLGPDDGEAVYVDVTGKAAPDSTPVGSINRARRKGEVASRTARARQNLEVH